MPRNASGQYDLPTGINPVVPQTTITASWANPTLQDMAAALTNSLDRTGLGGMTAAFKLFDGTAAAPGLSFLNETSLGLYRSNVGAMGLVTGGVMNFSIQTGINVSYVVHQFNTTTVHKGVGSKSFAFYNNPNGYIYISPETTLGVTDWDFSKGLAISSTTGDISCLAGLLVTNNITVFAGITASGVINANGSLTTTNFAASANASIQGSLTVNGAMQFNNNMNIYDIHGRRLYANGFVQNSYTFPSFTGNLAINFDAHAQSIYIEQAGPVNITSITCPQHTMMRFIFGATNSGVVTWPSDMWWPMDVVPNLAAGSKKYAVVTIVRFGGALFANASMY